MNLLSLVVFYVVGFLITLIILFKFHKELGFDFNQPKNDFIYHDWDVNTKIFIFFSITWVFFWLINLTLYILGKFKKLKS
jgi:hypothetical protein